MDMDDMGILDDEQPNAKRPSAKDDMDVLDAERPTERPVRSFAVASNGFTDAVGFALLLNSDLTCSSISNGSTDAIGFALLFANVALTRSSISLR